jgi:subtilisin-like proprotein convertase family protein
VRLVAGAAFGLAALWCPVPAVASAPAVRLRWNGEPPVAAAGQLLSGTVELTALADTTVSRFRVERAAPSERAGGGHRLVASDAPDAALLALGGRLVVAFQVEMGDPREPLVLCADADGAAVCRPIQLSAEAAEAGEGRLVPVTPPPGASPPPPPFPAPPALAPPDPDATAGAAAPSSPGLAVRVHGKLVYDREDRRAPFRGSFRPNAGTLASFIGEPMEGSWTLRIVNAGETSGTLARWSLGLEQYWTLPAVERLAPSTWRTIPPYGSVDSVLAVPRLTASGTLFTDVVVEDLDISGPRVGDLTISLISPSGTSVVLMDHDGGDARTLGDTRYRYEQGRPVEVGRATSFSNRAETSIALALASTPAAGVRVEAQARCHSTGGVFLTQASEETNASGDFDFDMYWDWPCTPDVRIEVESEGSWATVEDYLTQANYRWSTTYSSYSGSDLDLGWIEPDTNVGAIHIMNVIWRAARWLKIHRAVDMEHVDVQWPAGWPAPTSWYSAPADEILIRGGDGKSDTVVLHEYGHFWMDKHAHFPEDYGTPGDAETSYCNGVADDCADIDVLDGCAIWSCGHSQWCAEKPVIAWHEGFATWFADTISRDFEAIAGAGQGPTTIEEINWVEGCAEANGTFGYAPSTEGFLSALLRDIEDDDGGLPRDDHRGFPFGEGFYDRLGTGPDLIFDLVESTEPQDPYDFLGQLMTQHPELQPSLWETARHAGYETDAEEPGVARNLASPTHPAYAGVPVPFVALTWSPAPDDLSGIAGYAVTVSENGPAMPIAEENVYYGTYYTTDALPPGTYYLNVRAVDRAGHWSADYASYGPVLIVPATGGAVVPLLGGAVDSQLVTTLALDASHATRDLSYDLAAGTVVTVSVMRVASGSGTWGTLDPAVELRRIDGTLVASNLDGGDADPPGPGRNALLDRFTIPTSGRYLVRVLGQNGTLGPYTVEVRIEAAPGQTLSVRGGEAVAFGDANGDALPDLFVARGSLASKLFLNEGGALRDANATDLASFGGARTAAWGDYDGDGDLDLVVGSCSGQDHLYRNEGGALFQDVTTALLGDPGSCTRSVAWVDFDRDGDLDLHVVNDDLYGLAQDDRLFRNDGGGAWSRVAAPAIEGPGRGSVGIWSDYDDDGDPDLFLGSAGGAGESKLLRNEGDGAFVSAGSTTVASLEGVTAAAWVDVDTDGDLDLAVATESQGVRFLRDLGTAFSNESLSPFGGSSLGAGDFDNDGDVDLFLNEPSCASCQHLLRNDGYGTQFPDVTVSLYPLGTTDVIAFADTDDDGDLDLGGPTRIWRNDLASANRWLKLRLTGVGGASAIGARVRAFDGVRWRVREVSGGGGGRGQDDATVHFGLGGLTQIPELEVRWSNGVVTRLTDVATGQRLALTQPDRTLSVGDVSVTEGQSGSKSAVFTLQLASPSDGSTRVDWSTADAGATAGVDYAAASGTASFPAGATAAPVPVTVYGDTIPEPGEGIRLVLSRPVNARLSTPSAIATITNDDGATPVVSIGSVSIREGDGDASQLVFPLTLSVAVPQAVTLAWSPQGVTADAGRDFDGAGGNASFAPGATTASIAVPVFGDGDVEFDETLTVGVTALTNAALGGSPATGTILDDDAFRWNLPTTPAATRLPSVAGAGRLLGYSVAPAGDVNKDGYPDLVAGAPGQGRAELYLGSASGIAATPAWTGQPTACTASPGNSFYGHSVASAGDVNADGYADVVVGAPGCATTPGLFSEGAVFVYLGGAGGLSATPHWVTTGGVANRRFGWSVASAGDVDHDGASDVIVGSPFDTLETGRISVWLGASGSGLGASGLPETADWTVTGGAAVIRLGFSVSSAGDVNHDGYADVAAVASEDRCTVDSLGCAYVWLGGGSGPTTLGPGGVLAASEADTTLWGGAVSVAAAGDVNRDGYGDVVLGTGKYARVFFGSASGLDPAADWSVSLPGYGAFGQVVAGAGDVNGDGFADVLVGAREPSGSLWALGTAFLYLGSPLGPTTTPVWRASDGSGELYPPPGILASTSLASAGDVNEDGFADLVVGSPGYTEPYGYEDAGALFVYHGGPTAFSAAPRSLVPGKSAPAGDVNGDRYADVLSYDAATRALSLFVGGPGGYTAAARWSAAVPGTSTTLTLARAGDVDGDGYGDVLVGLPDEYPRGMAFLFRGSPSGLGSGAAWLQLGEQGGDRFGFALGSAGDVNRDGYGDVLVGAPQHAATRPVGGIDYEGKAYLYLGSPNGLAGTAGWSFQGEQRFFDVGPGDAQGLGASVGSAGDVNGDGFGDVILGHPSYDPLAGSVGSRAFGRSYVFYGGPVGLGAQPVWMATYDKGLGHFGQSVSGAEDVNGDGYDDVLVGSPVAGRAWLWNGDAYFFDQPDGLPANADWIAGSGVLGNPATGGGFGETVAGVGDVNGDGYADAATVSPGWSAGANRIFVYLGSETGLTRVPLWTAEGPAYATDVAAAGDVNGDGYADVLAGGRLYLGGFELGATLLPRLPSSLTQSVANGIVTFGGTVADAAGGSVRLEIELRRLDVPFTGEATDFGAWVPSGTPVTLAVGALPNGKYAWRVRAARPSGEASPWSDFGGTGSSDFTLSDTLGPIFTPASGDFTTASASVSFVGTASDPSGVLRVAWRNLAGGAGLASGTTSWSTPLIPLHAGANQLYVDGFDASGNRGAASHLVFRDPPAPSLSLLTVARAGSGSGRITSIPAGIDCAAGCSVQSLTPLRNAVVQLVAEADPGSLFTGFTGGPGCAEGAPSLDYPYTNACTGTFEPALTWGAASEAWRTTRSGLRAAAFVVRPNGESILAGSGTGQITTAKQRADGSEAWAVTHTAAGSYEGAVGLALDSAGGVAVAGSAFATTYDFLLLRYDAAGAEQWVRSYDGPTAGSDEARAVAVDAAGDAIVTGRSADDWATVKWSPSGTQLWAAREDGPSHAADDPHAIAVDGAGNVYVTGESQGDLLVVAYDPSGGVLWRDRYDGPNGLRDLGTALAVDSVSGSLFVAGESEGAYVVLRYSLAGARRWLQRYPNLFPGTSTPAAIAVDATRGRVVVTGTGRGDPGTSGLTDVFTVAYTVDGAGLWARRFDGSGHGDDGGVALAIGAGGEVDVAARSEGPGTGFDFVLIGYDAAGNERWIQRHADPATSDDEPIALGVDALGAVTVAGRAGTAARVVRYVPAAIDADRDAVADAADNCPYAPNPLQEDAGAIGLGSAPDGIGDACQCGDVSGDGVLTLADALLVTRSTLVPPTAMLVRPELCDVGGTAGCTLADAVVLRRAVLVPPTAVVVQQCGPALPPSP